MEKLVIENFLSLRNVEIEFRKFNVLIGGQAAGKSIILKLLYYFNNLCGRYIMNTVEIGEGIRFYNNNAKESFYNFFKLDENDINGDTVIKYINNDVEINIYGSKTGKIKINISNNIKNAIKRIKCSYEKAIHEIQEIEKEESIYNNLFVMDKVFENMVYGNNKYNGMFRAGVFIPSSRSFFSIIKENIMSFLRENIDMDVFLKEFGGRYEIAKRIYDQGRYIKYSKNKDWNMYIDSLFKDTIKGEYIIKKKEDYIKTRETDVKLSNASSGQQEVLPMMIVFMVFSEMNFVGERKKSFYIEEPEAHIFPLSQRKIVDAFAAVPNMFNHNVYITTHSPYIISELNNIILFNMLINRGRFGNEIPDKFKHMPIIKPEDISAYSVSNGKVQDMYNREDLLIESDLLDKVAVEVDEIFSDLLTYIEDK